MSAESASATQKTLADLLDFVDWSGVECLNQSTSHSLANALKQGKALVMSTLASRGIGQGVVGGDFEQGQGTFCFNEKPKLDGVAALVAVKRAVFSEGEISVSGNLVSGAKITMNFLFPMLHGLGASIDYERGYREDEGLNLESDADEQLLIYIPFTQVIKLHSIAINGPEDEGERKNKESTKSKSKAGQSANPFNT
ncbi:hypothetical protein C3L33_18459, partial [Rhododendron williamsianum]